MPVASAASLEGASCKKFGTTKVVKGSLYKCQLAKKKRIWVLDKTPKKSTSTVRVTPEGAAFLPADYPLIGAIARDKFKSQSATGKGIFEVLWDPTTTSSKRSWIGKQVAAIEEAYSPLMPADSKITILVIGSDVEWARTQLRLLSKDSQSLWDDYNNKFFVSTKCAKPNGYVIPDNVFPADYTTYRGLGGGVIPGKGFAFVTMSNCDDYMEKDILFHETFHAVQYLNSYKSAPFFGNQSWGWGLLPPWIREGQAQYVGMRMADTFSGKSVAFDAGGTIWFNAGKRWKSEYQYLTTYETTDPYWIGAIIQEYLIAKFGVRKNIEVFNATVLKDKVNNLDIPDRFAPFDEAFLEVFGQSRESFYQEVKPYIQWSLDQQGK